MIGATPSSGDTMTTETEQAFSELLETVAATHARMVEQLADEPDTLLEAHKWVLSILQVAAEVNLWADTARPRFVEIVGPYKKWGGDNSDAFYCYAPIDPNRTYRVTLHPGDAVYMSLTVYGGPNDGRYSERIVGSVNSHEASRGPDGAIHIVLSPDRAGGAGRRLDPPRTRRGRRHHPRLPRGPGPRAPGHLAHRGRRPARDLPRGRRGPGAPPACHDHLGTRAGRHRAHPPRHAQRDRSALPGPDHDVRLGRRRRRLRHGRLRAGGRRGPRHQGPLPRVRLLEHVPVEPPPPHLQLRLRAGDDQRRPGALRERRVLDHRRLGPAPGPPQLGLDRRATAAGASGSAGSCPAETPEQPQVEVLPVETV